MCAFLLQAPSPDSAVAAECHENYLDHCHVASPVKPSFKAAANTSKAEGQTEQQDAKGVVLKLVNYEGLLVSLQSAAQRTVLEHEPLQVPTARKDRGSAKVRMLLMCTSEFAVYLSRRRA